MSADLKIQEFKFLVKRRLGILKRTKLLPRVRRGPNIVHIVVDGKNAPNRGDAAIALATPQILKTFLPTLNFVQIPIGEIRSKPTLSEQFGPCDMVIVGGGGLYGKWFSLEHLLALKAMKVPIVLYAIGLNSNFGDDWITEEIKSTIKGINELASLSSVRDQATCDFLKSLGQDSEIIADPVAFYRPTIGKAQKKPKRERLRIGLNLPFHGFQNQTQIMRHASPIIKEVLGDLKRHGADIHYFMHHPREQDLLDQFDDLKMQIHRGNVDQLLAAYQNVDVAVSGMLHSSIFAFNSEVPFLTLAYDSKQQAFSELIGNKLKPLILEDIASVSLREGLSNLIENRIEINGALKQKREQLWEVHRGFVEKIISLFPPHKIQLHRQRVSPS